MNKNLVLTDHQISKNFWEARAQRAYDSRSVTLTKAPKWISKLGVSLCQSWLFRRLAQRSLTPNLIIDVGCGNGDWTIPLAKLGRQLRAFDFCQGFVQQCRIRLKQSHLLSKVSVQQMDMRNISIPMGTDLVVAGAVTQYLGDYELDSFIEKVSSALVPEGLLYLRTTVSNTSSTMTSLSNRFQGIYRPIDWYDRLFDKHGFVTLTRETAANFVPEELAHRIIPKFLLSVFKPLLLGWFKKLWAIANRKKNTDVVCYLLTKPASGALVHLAA